MTAKQTSSSTPQSNPPASHPARHLSAEHLEAMLRRSPFRAQAGKHLEACTGCREEVERLSELLSRFRASSVLYAEQALTRTTQPKPSLSAASPVRWALAAGVLACVLITALLLPSPRSRTALTHTARRAAAPAQLTQISDEALLAGVQDDISASVPAPLQLLAASSSSSPDSFQVAAIGQSSHPARTASHSR